MNRRNNPCDNTHEYTIMIILSTDIMYFINLSNFPLHRITFKQNTNETNNTCY